MKTIWKTTLFAAVCMAPLCLKAEELARRSIAVPGRGSVELALPANWNAIREEQAGEAPRVSITSTQGVVNLVMELVWHDMKAVGLKSSSEPSSAMLDAMAALEQSRGTIKKEVVKEVSDSGEATALYARFSQEATTTAAVDAELKQVATGAVNAGDVWISFDLVFNGSDSAVMGQGLEIVRSLRLLNGEALAKSTATPLLPPGPAVDTKAVLAQVTELQP